MSNYSIENADPMPRPDTIWTSPPMTIGKHEWRIRQWRHHRAGVVITFEWRKADPAHTTPGMPVGYWYDMCDWPRYDHNNGQTAGCPATLNKLYDQHKATLIANKASVE